MPDPWDLDKIVPNLRKLAQVNSGDKVCLRDGLVDINKGGWGLFRKDADSISHTGGNNGVLAQLMNEAVTCYQMNAASITLQHLQGARDGLIRLRGTYTTRDAKREKLEELLADTELLVFREEFHARWKGRLGRFSQRNFVDEACQGVCFGFCMDWIRRIAFK
jgi:hypothetical protein